MLHLTSHHDEGEERGRVICANCRRPLKNVAAEVGHETARLNAALQAQISDVRREVARMGLRAEDEQKALALSLYSVYYAITVIARAAPQKGERSWAEKHANFSRT